MSDEQDMPTTRSKRAVVLCEMRNEILKRLWCYQLEHDLTAEELLGSLDICKKLLHEDNESDEDDDEALPEVGHP